MFLSWLQPTQERGSSLAGLTAAPGFASVDRLRQIVPLLPLSRHHRVPRPLHGPDMSVGRSTLSIAWLSKRVTCETPDLRSRSPLL